MRLSLRLLTVAFAVVSAVAIFYLWGIVGELVAFVIALTAERLYRRHRASGQPIPPA